MTAYSLGMLHIQRTNSVSRAPTPTRIWQGLALALTVLFMAGDFSGQTASYQSVPQTQEKALDGSSVNFPNNAKLVLLVIGFTHKSDKQCDGWNQKLKAEYSHNPHVAYYEMADFQGVPSFVMWMISHGLHRKIPKDEQSYFVPFFHHEDEWKKLTRYSVPEDAYLIVAAADGRILWQTHGPQTDDKYAELQEAIQTAPAK